MDKKYKIGIIVKDFLSKEKTGIENYLVNLLATIPKYNSNQNIFYIYTTDKNLKIKNYIVRYVKPTISWMHTDLPIAIFKDKLDLIFSPIPSLPLLSNKIKKVITVHDLSFEYMDNKKNKMFSKYFILKAIKSADKIVAVSNFTKDQILKNSKISKDKIEVIHEAFNKNIFKQKKVKKDKKFFKILCVGTLTKRKNFTHIIKTLPIIEDKIGDTIITIVGKSGDDFQHIKSTIEDLKAKGKVNITGYVSDTRLTTLYNNHDVFVYASKEEGFGIPILEAFNCKIPVVTSTTSATKEIAEDAAIFVDPNSIFNIAKGIIMANNKRDMLIEKGYRIVKKYSWDKMTEQTIALFYKTLNPYVEN